MEIKVTALSKEELLKYADSNEIPLLSTTEACKPALHNALEYLNRIIEGNNDKILNDLDEIGNLATGILCSGDMAYAKVSKIELVIILTKVIQLKGMASYEDALPHTLGLAFGEMKDN